MIPILLATLKQRRNFALWWTVGIVSMTAMIMLVYPSIRDQADELAKTLDQLPEAIRGLKSSNTEDLLSPVGFLNSQLFYATLPLFYGIMSIMLGSSLLSRDEQNHTLELLLARPVSRGRILLAKALAGTIIITLSSLATFVTVLALGLAVDISVAATDLAITMAYMLALCISFGAIAFTCSALSFARKASLGLAILFSLGGYLLASLAGLADSIQAISKLLPFHYYNPYDILNGTYSVTLSVYIATIFTVSVLVSWLGFRRRDIE